MTLHNSQKKHNKKLNNLPVKQIFTGVYRICNKKTGEEINGINYITIEIHDATGSRIGQCLPEAINWYQNKPYELVNIKGYCKAEDNTKSVHILEIYPNNDLENLGSTLSLPRQLSADPTWLERLIHIRQSLKSPTLSKFVDTVFADNDIGLAFLQVAGSSKYHHNHPGGLLAHSVEVAEIAAEQYYSSQDLRDIAVVAALFHDVGKVRTLAVNQTTTILGKVVSHDSLTLEICALALKDLDRTWPEASYTMRHVWTSATPGAKYGFEQNCTIANIVKFADRLSVDRYYETETFKAERKSHGLAWDGKRYFWRPTPEPKIIERKSICQLNNIQ